MRSSSSSLAATHQSSIAEASQCRSLGLGVVETAPPFVFSPRRPSSRCGLFLPSKTTTTTPNRRTTTTTTNRAAVRAGTLLFPRRKWHTVVVILVVVVVVVVLTILEPLTTPAVMMVQALVPMKHHFTVYRRRILVEPQRRLPSALPQHCQRCHATSTCATAATTELVAIMERRKRPQSSSTSTLFAQSPQQQQLSARRTGTQLSLARSSTSSRTRNNTPISTVQSDNTSTTTAKKYLVIVESPAKCATIAQILNGNLHDPNHYQVVSCRGHIRNLNNQLPPKDKVKKGSSSSNSTTKASSSSIRKIAGIDWHDPHYKYRPDYVILPEQWPVVRELQQAVANVDAVLLATDPDREGEAMAWHLQQVLQLVEPNNKNDNNDQKKPYQRIRFTEITPRAILEAVREAIIENNSNNNTLSLSASHHHHHHTVIDPYLVTAQETRRVLDRLAGFTVSPVLWKKIAPGLSAGRVQSVGLQLIVQRERQRLAFESTPYCDAIATLSVMSSTSSSNQNLTARLVSLNGTAVATSGKDFTSQGQQLTEASRHKIHWRTVEEAKYWIDQLLLDDDNDNSTAAVWRVESISSRPRTTAPPRPYKTSTLQQDAVRQLGWSVQSTMRTAQQLYEAGCISYMRTDSTTVSQDAERTVTETVSEQFGTHLVSSASSHEARSTKKKKSSVAPQEAHEAIRPAIQSNGQFLTPEQIPLTTMAAVQLYRLIYQRTLAHRMTPLVTNQTQVVIAGSRRVRGDNDDESAETVLHFRLSGSVVVSPGYTLAYSDSVRRDDAEHHEPSQQRQQPLPPLREGQLLQLHQLVPVPHETQPPPRYTEATFVKELEALGVGRPSTYAKIVQILRDRAYVGSPVRANSDSTTSVGRRSRKVRSGAAISAMRAAGGVEFTGDGSGARGPLVPSLSAFVVCALLEKHCPTYVDPTFTARMEDRLDQIASWSGGGSGDPDNDATATWSVEDERVAYLDEFYAGENGLAAQIQRIEDTVDAVDARRAVLPALMTLTDDENSNGVAGEIGLFVGPWGPYVQTIDTTGNSSSSQSAEKPPTVALPPSMAADLSTIKPKVLKALLANKQEGGIILGQHPDDRRSIRLKTGRFGAFLQWGDDGDEKTTTHSLPRSMAMVKDLDNVAVDDGNDMEAIPESTNLVGITLEEAIGYVGLPRTVSVLDDKPVMAAIGPYGPYLKYNNQYLSLSKNDGNVLTIGAEDAEVLVTDRIINKTSTRSRGALAELGEKDGCPVTVKSGRFGVYLNWKRINAKLPAEYTDKPDTFPLEEAWSLIQQKGASDTKGGKPQSTNLVPPRPKRPLTAYLHFCSAKRSEVATSVLSKGVVPQKALGEVSKKLASLWAKASAEERKIYEELAFAGKVEYEEATKVWSSETNGMTKLTPKFEASSTKTITSAPKVELTKPKRPRSAYLFFCAAKRAEVAETVKSLGEISKALARLWAETSDRKEYEMLAEADKKRYQDEMIIFSSSSQAAGRISRRGLAGTTEKSLPNSQKAPSAYMVFCRKYRPSLVDENGERLSFGEATKRLAAMWRECDEQTRSEFQAMAAQEKMDNLSVAEL